MATFKAVVFQGGRHLKKDGTTNVKIRVYHNSSAQYIPTEYFRLSGNIWLVSFKISYLCLPLFYETRTTPSCHPSGCAYRQL